MEDKPATNADPPPDASPISGVAPPAEYRWKPGQSGNPTGKRCAGWSIIEYFNALEETPEAELERIARDKAEKPNRRAAAIQWLDILASAGELADFAELCDGEKDLRQTKEAGAPTRLLKRVKTKSRKIPGTDTVEREREVELADKGGANIDRIIDRTLGRAHQSLDITSNGETVAPRLIVPGPIDLVEWQRQVAALRAQAAPATEGPPAITQESPAKPVT